MPNATPNQPLNQHPVPNMDLYAVAQDATLLGELAVGDTLLVPPPPQGGARLLLADLGVIVAVAGGAGNTVAQLIYKNKDGNEVSLGAVTVLPDSLDVIPLGYLLSPDDQGLFLRVISATVGGEVSAYATWRDVRNVTFKSTALTTSFQDVSPETPEGNTFFLPSVKGSNDLTAAKIFNFDTAVANVELVLTDGNTDLSLGTAVAAIGGVQPIALPFMALPPGFSFKARLQAAPTTRSPVLSMPMSLSNQGPARQNQGGAY